MKILLTGVTGYIAQRLLPVLVASGHQVVCCVRDSHRFHADPAHLGQVTVIEVNFLEPLSLKKIPKDIDVAYYLIHSMATQNGDFEKLEEICAGNFRQCIEETHAEQVIYLSGICNSEELSKHLFSRKKVESILYSKKYALTTLRAGIVIGSGSASFEIIRDLVEKLPLMITPKWLHTKTQPIAIRNVIEFLAGVLKYSEVYHQSFDIGGPDILSYKDMLLKFAAVRKLKRRIYILPVMTPKISSYWLYFITATSYTLASNLVNSLKSEVICKPNHLAKQLGIHLLTYEEAIELAFDKFEQNHVPSSWKDAQTSDILHDGLAKLAEVPKHGCFKDQRKAKIANPKSSVHKIWCIGGKTGWYYGNWLWEVRGLLDQITGGVGMRRGRRVENELVPGDALDFWRVLLAKKNELGTEARLLLYAEMKLPGEAWLEFRLDSSQILTQTATFRPRGLLGRIYWYAVWPFHGFIFKGMLAQLASSKE